MLTLDGTVSAALREEKVSQLENELQFENLPQ